MFSHLPEKKTTQQKSGDSARGEIGRAEPSQKTHSGEEIGRTGYAGTAGGSHPVSAAECRGGMESHPPRARDGPAVLRHDPVTHRWISERGCLSRFKDGGGKTKDPSRFPAPALLGHERTQLPSQKAAARCHEGLRDLFPAFLLSCMSPITPQKKKNIPFLSHLGHQGGVPTLTLGFDTSHNRAFPGGYPPPAWKSAHRTAFKTKAHVFGVVFFFYPTKRYFTARRCR